MQKRGPIIGLIGGVLLAISFVVVMSIYPQADPTMQGEFFMPDLFEGMFDRVSEEIRIFPGDSSFFSYDTESVNVPLLWGIQITDYQEGDSFSVSISSLYGETLPDLIQEGPILFDVFQIVQDDQFSFEVTNTGNRPISILMMFSEDPDNSEALTDPNSPLMTMVFPLLISGFLLIIGIIVIIIGIIITILDWKKEKKQPSYY